jgi:hypothetical protein
VALLRSFCWSLGNEKKPRAAVEIVLLESREGGVVPKTEMCVLTKRLAVGAFLCCADCAYEGASGRRSLVLGRVRVPLRMYF